MTRITIGMPVYNGAATMAAALDSLLAQSVGDFVIVISDNGSTDDTETICRAYAARDPRVTYVRQPANLGPAMNFRFVLFEARTPYFMWAAADDLWAPSFIATLMGVLERDPNAVLAQSRVLFTVNGTVSHLATGTYALPHDAARNAAQFFRNPADNSRYYGVFRTAALQAVFPPRPFHGLDWAVSASTLRFGTHVEVPDVLMIRDSSDATSYERSVSQEHRFVLWRIFPIAFMTKWLLIHRSVPFSPALLMSLGKLNLYMHFRFGLYRWGRLADRYLETNSIRIASVAVVLDIIRAMVRPGAKQRMKVDLKRLRQIAFAVIRRMWRTVPMTMRQRNALKLRLFRLLGRRAIHVPFFGEWLASVPTPTSGSAWAPPPPPSLPASGWKMPQAPADPASADAVIIVAHDDILSTLALIDSLSTTESDPPTQIVVVDNGSTDITCLIDGMCPGVLFRQLTNVASYGEAARLGMTAVAAHEWIFVEQKLLAHTNFARALLSGLDDVEMVGPQTRYADGRLRAAGGTISAEAGPQPVGRGGNPAEFDHAYPHEIEFCPAAFAIRSETLEIIGGLATDYASFGITSLDTAARARAANAEVLYWPAAAVTDYSGDYDPVAHDYRESDAWARDWTTFKTNHGTLLSQLEHLRSGQRKSAHRPQSKWLLYIDADTPAPDQNSGSNDAINLMRMLDRSGFRVTFIPESNFAHRGKYTEQLQALGVHTLCLPTYGTVREVLMNIGRQLDVVFLCRADIMERHLATIRELAPQARVVFNTVDLHALRAKREAELSTKRGALKAAQALWTSELASIAKADATIVLSSYEQHLLAKELPSANIHVIPLIRDIPSHLDAPGYDARRDIVFVGTYQHRPNHDAAVYFAKEIWPLIHARMPDLRCLLVGSSVTSRIRALAGNGIEVIGFVEDLDDLLAKCRLTIAPLRYGAGLKGKVATSLQAGVPVVATPMAVEGTTLEHDRNILVADAPADFADAVVRLYTDPVLWERLSQAGFAYAREEYSIEANLPRLHHLLESIGQVSDLQLMQDEIAAADPLYQPSAFWQMLNEKNRRSLQRNLQVFKQTVNNNYYQWLPGDTTDNQIRNLTAFLEQHPSTVPDEVVAASGPHRELATLKAFYNNNPFDNPAYFRFYAYFVGMLWHFVATNDPSGQHERLEEPQLGSPIPIQYRDKWISQDLANSLHEWTRVQALVGTRPVPEKPRVLELGAGYGRLAYVFLAAQSCRYVVVDIPPALWIARWYLTQLFPDRKVFGFRHFARYEDVAAEIEAAELCFLTANQLALLPPGFADISVSISSLHEMRHDQIVNYKTLLERVTRSIIYFKQWTRWTNPADGIDVGRSDFILSESWQLILDCPHPVHDAMTELGYVRTNGSEAASPEPVSTGR
jgi:putative sugar O-methyltransferase